MTITNSIFHSSLDVFLQAGPSDEVEHFFTLDNNQFLDWAYNFEAGIPSRRGRGQVQISRNMLGPYSRMTTRLDNWTEFNINNNTCRDVSCESSLSIESTTEDSFRFNISHNHVRDLSLYLKPLLMPELIFEENHLSGSVITIQLPWEPIFTSHETSKSSIIRRNRISGALWVFQKRVTDGSNWEVMEMMANEIDDLELVLQNTGFRISENIVKKLVLSKVISHVLLNCHHQPIINPSILIMIYHQNNICSHHHPPTSHIYIIIYNHHPSSVLID